MSCCCCTGCFCFCCFCVFPQVLLLPARVQFIFVVFCIRVYCKVLPVLSKGSSCKGLQFFGLCPTWVTVAGTQSSFLCWTSAFCWRWNQWQFLYSCFLCYYLNDYWHQFTSDTQVHVVDWHVQYSLSIPCVCRLPWRISAVAQLLPSLLQCKIIWVLNPCAGALMSDISSCWKCRCFAEIDVLRHQVLHVASLVFTCLVVINISIDCRLVDWYILAICCIACGPWCPMLANAIGIFSLCGNDNSSFYQKSIVCWSIFVLFTWAKLPVVNLWSSGTWGFSFELGRQWGLYWIVQS